MRRKQSEITSSKEISRILSEARIGRMASHGRDGYPYITPVNYVWFNGSVYFHCSRKGEKLDNIKQDNRVCFEVDIPLSYLGLEFDPKRPTCHVHQFYHSVIIRGTAELVEDIEEKVNALNALMIAHEGNDAFRKVDGDTEGVKICAVVAIRVDKISGKSDLGQKKSAEEKGKISRYLNQRGTPGDLEAARLIGGKNE